MNKAQATLSSIQARLKKLGINIGDVSTYQKKKHMYFNGEETVIIAGYLPNKACLITIETVIETNGSVWGSVFKVQAELLHEEKYNTLVRNIPRVAVGSEGISGPQFDINTQAKTLNEGFVFLKEVLKRCKSELAPKFTERVHIWYVPVYTDAFTKLEKKYGKNNSRVFDHFNRRVLAKLPQTMFTKEQYL